MFIFNKVGDSHIRPTLASPCEKRLDYHNAKGTDMVTVSGFRHYSNATKRIEKKNQNFTVPQPVDLYNWYTFLYAHVCRRLILVCFPFKVDGPIVVDSLFLLLPLFVKVLCLVLAL